jgi:hypothetical protein
MIPGNTLDDKKDKASGRVLEDQSNDPDGNNV